MSSKGQAMRIIMFPAQVGRNNNPFITILAEALKNTGAELRDFNVLSRSGDVLHVHWLEGLFWGRRARWFPALPALRARRLLKIAQQMRARGRPVVWTVHNLTPHDFASDAQRQLFETFHDAILPLITDVVCMSPEVRDQVKAHFPQLAVARLHVIPHPHYVDYFNRSPQALPPEAAQFIAAGGGPLLGTFGMLRPYKGIPALIAGLRESGRDFRMLVAGSGPPEEIAAIRDAMNKDPRCLLVARRISEAELIALTRACRLVIFNFRKILNSGSVLAALSLGAQVLAPRLGALQDLQAELDPGWMKLFDNQIIDTLGAALDTPPPAEAGADLSFCSPERVATAHFQVYNRTI